MIYGFEITFKLEHFTLHVKEWWMLTLGEHSFKINDATIKVMGKTRGLGDV